MASTHTNIGGILGELARLNASHRGEESPLIRRDFYADIPFFGQVICETRDVDGVQTNYYPILRHFGWAVVVGLTTDQEVIVLLQWKPGMNQWGIELPPGGIGNIVEEPSDSDRLVRIRQAYTRETGYGNGSWERLGRIQIESGKYRGVTPDDHGFDAHLYLATDLEPVNAARHAQNEKIRIMHIPFKDLFSLVHGGHLTEESAVAAVFHAALRLGNLVENWD